MNFKIKTPPHAPRHQPQRGQPAWPQQPRKPDTVQPKMDAARQVKLPPAAAPVYRPQPAPKVLQPKMPAPHQPTRLSSVAPAAARPIHRPQPAPKVSPPKPFAQSQSHGAQSSRTPFAPSVYRPEAKKIVQPKMAGAAFVRPQNVLQPMMAVRKSARISAPGYVHTTVNLVAPQTVDKHGTKYWNGFRQGLSFSAATKLVMWFSKYNCQINGASCTGAASSIDHVTDFATTSSMLPTHTYCDGTNHWSGVLLSDAQADYNNTANLQWACTSCNSSKSGARGLYSPPRHQGACPGATCTL